MRTCEQCEKRNLCTELCDKAKRYVDQDKVKPVKIVPQGWIERRIDATENIWDYQFDWELLSKKQKIGIIKKLAKGGYSQRKIATVLPISKTMVFKYLHM